jgi:DNA modification methylase
MLLDQVNAVRVSTLENGRNGPETESRGPGQHFDGSSPLGSDLRRLDQSVEIIPVNRLASYKGNARTHSQKQVRQIANSIKRFGFLNPVLADDGGQIIAGHGRVEAAKLLGIAAVPVLRITHLTEAEKRAYVLADNRLAELAGWDREILAIELQGLVDIGFEVEATGFSIPDIDLVLEGAAEAQGGPPDREDAIPDVGAVSVSRASDLWVLGEHRLLCGDARDAAAYQILMAGERAEMAFTDPPYNVRVDRNVCGLGRIRHREFPMASGEMDEGEFTAFLRTAFEHLAAHSEDGAIHFVCMDWRHMGEMLAAGKAVYCELKNLCVWNKSNAGMGSFYRSKHELVFVWKVWAAPHLNNFELGQHGRSRTNVWDYDGITSMRVGRLEELAMHPTVKPVAMVADAIKDCSRRKGIVLDAFLGSGTTLIAAERTGRRARGIEFDPAYVDVAVRRWQTYTGKYAMLRGTGQRFEEVEELRQTALRNDAEAA